MNRHCETCNCKSTRRTIDMSLRKRDAGLDVNGHRGTRNYLERDEPVLPAGSIAEAAPKVRAG
jgi:hypothetical protein